MTSWLSSSENLYVDSVWNEIRVLTRAVLENEFSLLMRREHQDADIEGNAFVLDYYEVNRLVV